MTSASPTSPPSLVGKTLSGKYRLESVVGEGAMGTVYKGCHLVLDRVVAVKVLHRHVMARPDALPRFRREAQAASQLQHPNSLQVLDFGEEGGRFYIVMEFVEGHDLEDELRDGKPLPEPRIVHLMSQVCGALARAHDLGIVHRDMKPGNVVIGEVMSDDGRLMDLVKVVDFGLARLDPRGRETVRERPTLSEGNGALAGTADGVFGTPHYMSPEQCRGEEVDARSDLYSVGVLLYQMATGRLPFDDANALTVMVKHTRDAPRPPSEVHPGVSPELEAIILHALEKDPAERYASARDLRRDLQALMGWSDPAITQPPGLVPAPPPRPARRRVWTTPRLAAAAAVAAMGGLLAVGLAEWLSGDEPPAAPAPAAVPAPVAGAEADEAGSLERLADRLGGGAESVARGLAELVAAPGEEAGGAPEASPAPAPTAPAPAPAAPAPAKPAQAAPAVRPAEAPAVAKPTAEAAPPPAKPAAEAAPPPAKPTAEAAPTGDVVPARPAEAAPAAKPPEAAPAKASPAPAPAKPPTREAAPATRLVDEGSELGVTVGVQKVHIVGSLAPEGLAAAVRAQRGALEACYRDAARAHGGAPPTSLAVTLMVVEDGGARNVKAIGGRLPGLTDCAERTLGRLRLADAPGGRVGASFTLRFAAP